MSVCLIFPPPWDTSQAYLSTPSLASYLKKHHHQAFQIDLNLEFVSYLTHSENFAHAISKLHENARLSDLRASNAAKWNLKVGEHLQKRLGDFDRIMRSPTDFYDSKKYFSAQRILGKIYDLWSTAYSPTTITPISFRINREGDHLVSAKDFIVNARSNPLLRFLDSVFPEDGPQYSQVSLFGISIIYDDQIVPALTVANFLKARYPGAKVVCGGGAISQYARVYLDTFFEAAPYVDFVVIDDGYGPLLKIAEALRHKRVLAPTDNILINRGLGKAKVRPPQAESHFAPPDPDYSGLALGRYHSPELILSFKTSKGCKWGRCTFCSESAFKEYSAGDVTDVVASIKRQSEESGLRFVNFADSDISPARFVELSEELSRQDVEIGWSIRARLDPLFTSEVLRAGSRAGCRKIFFGLESASQRLLKLMKKGTQIRHVPDLLQSCRDAKILSHLFTFVGFPSETRAEAEMTRDFLWEHISNIASFNIGIFQLRTFSDAFRSREQLGLKLSMEKSLRSSVDSNAYEITEGLSQRAAAELQQEFLLFFRKRFFENNLPYDVNKWSGYVNLAGIPYWDSHNLAYYDQALRRLDERKPTPRIVDVPRQRFEILRLDHEAVTIVLIDELRTITMSRRAFSRYQEVVGTKRVCDDAQFAFMLVTSGLGTLLESLS
ncbi:B12-binding domain-containing radical SAM protein [Bradyrhizobium sp. HKCCYLS3077]|uniref:B12-binding domain-containing radical SAM protein n=1 Tax=Bradyrhizobium sp. HKCCYLS3077 TaxID=3420761 RepID=UPI003EB83EC4